MMQNRKMSPRNLGAWLAVVGLSVITLYALGKVVRRVIFPQAAPTPTSTWVPIVPASTPTVTTTLQAKVSPAPEVSATSWERFRDQFGESLVAKFDRGGRLLSVRGEPGKGQEASSKFDPTDSKKAIARAREVIDAAHKLLGLRPQLPLVSPLVQGTPSSAQVYFQESKDGLSLAPLGGVTVDLGRQGELLGLDSEYVSDLRVVNDTRLTPEQARVVAGDGVGGELLIWVARPAPGESAEGRHAYRYNVKGRDIIVDAASGKILHERDQRRY